MSRPHLSFVAALACSVLSLGAQAGESEQNRPVGRYQVKNRSSFELKETGRAPFWPIGYVKADKKAAVIAEPLRTKLSPEMFSVTSILLGNPSLAVINGRAYGEGEYLRMKAPAGAGPGAASPAGASMAAIHPNLRVRVVRIVDGLVTLQSADGQSVVVSLRRDELGERKPPEQEVLNDR